jgi:hypothetical protein
VRLGSMLTFEELLGASVGFMIEPGEVVSVSINN